MRVAVVGAGIIGLASAYHLLLDGHDVTVIDAAIPGAGASQSNAGWVVPADVGPVAAPGVVLKALKWMLRKDSPLYVKPSLKPDFLRFMLTMARRSNAADFHSAFLANLALTEGTMQLLDAYVADGMDFDMQRAGLLMLFAEPANLHHHVADLETARHHGLDPQVLTGSEAAEREPALNPSLAGGIYFPHERHLRPDLLVAHLARRCRELGATILERTPLVSVRKDSRVRALVVAAGELEAEAYLLATGAHSGPLSRLFGPPMPVRPGKGYSVDYLPPPVQLRAMVNLCDAKVAVTPMSGRLRLAGTMEFAGLDFDVNPVRVQAIRNAPRRYFVDWDPTLAPSVGPWAGARPMTPDGLPIMGRLPALDNAWIATGHGMFGITLGPASGRAMATAIGTGVEPAVLAPFSPHRYAGRNGRAAVYPRRSAPAGNATTTKGSPS